MAKLGKKLQLKTEQPLLLLHAPEQVAQALQEEGFACTQAAGKLPALRACTAALIFVQSAAALEQLQLQTAPPQPESILWIAYPKKSSDIKTDLTRDKGWQLMADLQYEAVRQVAVDEVWSALRFRHKTERKQDSMFGVDMPGIDRVTKTVVIPEDLKAALAQAEVLEAFERMAFTHRKEHVVSVLDAKKPETRARRIAKVVEQVTRI